MPIEFGTGELGIVCEIVDLGNGVGMDFVRIPTGTFMMGSPSSEEGRGNNEDQHEVTLSNNFLVSTTEITQGMYYQLMGYMESRVNNEGITQTK